jgi:uncharacterized protein
LAPHARITYLVERMNALVAEDIVKHVEFSIQTNGVLLTRKNVEFLARHKIGIGISVDGMQAEHDAARVDHKGEGSYARVIEGYWTAVDHANETKTGSYPGLLSVAVAGRDGGAILNHFAEDLRASHMDFLMPDYTHDDAEVDDAYIDGVTRFLVNAFRAWARRADKNLRVRYIDEVVSALLYDDVAVDVLSSELRYFDLVAISSDGTIAPEDTIKTISEDFQNLGNVADVNALQEIRTHPRIEELRASIFNPPPKCAACELYGVCGGGKSVNRYSRANGLNNPSVFCESIMAIHYEVAAWLVEAGIPAEDIERRLLLAKSSLDTHRPLVLEAAA